MACMRVELRERIADESLSEEEVLLNRRYSILLLQYLRSQNFKRARYPRQLGLIGRYRGVGRGVRGGSTEPPSGETFISY